MKKIVLIVAATATLLASCSKKNNSKDVEINVLKIALDSTIKANDFLSKELSISVNDSTMAKYCQIPDSIKKMYWTYKQTEYSAIDEYEKAETVSKKYRDSAVDLIKANIKKINDAADNDYKKLADSLNFQFFNKRQNLIELLDSSVIDTFSPYLGSREEYWSVDIGVNGHNYYDYETRRKKMPKNLVLLISILKPKDSIRNSVKINTEKLFEDKINKIEKEYSESLITPSNIRDNKITEAYKKYLFSVENFELKK